MVEEIDVIEQNIEDISPSLLIILLSDKTTKTNIRWGCDDYINYGTQYRADQEILPELITGIHTSVIQPRVAKDTAQQTQRTRSNAEVFTPSWVCNEQNNMIDSAWFGRDDVFNKSMGKKWKVIPNAITFPRDKIWKDYIDARRIEISCGEAPYLVSRYDTVTGEIIPIEDRIGLLDRKLRIVSENAETDEEWFEWVIRSFQSVYGYDFQGDNVLLARENLLFTFIEYFEQRSKKTPALTQMKKIANIISWNIWQMNGITMTAPYSQVEPVYKQMSIMDFIDTTYSNFEEETITNEVPCKIFDWRSKKSIEFRSLVKGD